MHIVWRERDVASIVHLPSQLIDMCGVEPRDICIGNYGNTVEDPYVTGDHIYLLRF